MSSAALEAWLERIGTEHPKGVERGLAHVRRVAERLGVLPPARRTVVVAGTNGKGSTTAFAEQLLLSAGLAVGTTTSPHMHRFNERIRVGGEEADDARIVAAFEAVEVARGDEHLSYFEYAVLAALVAIKRAGMDVAVLEVGLGGRLDAVNVVDADVAVITSIGLDHQEYLGNTRAEIGAEKAGIMRPRVPVVVGEPAPPQSVLARAAALGAKVHLAGRDFGCGDSMLWLQGGEQRTTYPLPATSAVDPVNAAAALQAVTLAGHAPSQADVQRTAERTRNPGRCEAVRAEGRSWVLDVAHNADAARFFAAQVLARFPNRRRFGVVGCLADKDARGIAAALRSCVDDLAFADTVTPRGQPAAAMRAAAGGDTGAFAGSLDAAANRARSLADRAQDVILVCGSFDVVERMRARLLTCGDAD